MRKLNPKKWFNAFIKSYQTIIDRKYADKKGTFPFYPPVDIYAYFVDDSKGILPSVVVFFDSGFDEYPASNWVFIDNKKIQWPSDFDDLEGIDRDTAIDVVWHETFYEEQKNMRSFSQEAFPSDFLSSKPEDKALIYVQKHLIREEQRERFELFRKLSEVRKGTLGVEGLNELLKGLFQMHGMKDEDKADVLCRAFWAMGFEAINLDRLKDVSEFKDLKKIPHVDLIAVLLSEKTLIAVEEGEMNKERWYKVHSLEATLKAIRFLGSKGDWQISFVAIGRKSKGVEYLEGNVQVISHDLFQQILKEYFESKTWAPALHAARRIMGYKLDIFKITT